MSLLYLWGGQRTSVFYCDTVATMNKTLAPSSCLFCRLCTPVVLPALAATQDRNVCTWFPTVFIILDCTKKRRNSRGSTMMTRPTDIRDEPTIYMTHVYLLPSLWQYFGTSGSLQETFVIETPCNFTWIPTSAFKLMIWSTETVLVMRIWSFEISDTLVAMTRDRSVCFWSNGIGTPHDCHSTGLHR